MSAKDKTKPDQVLTEADWQAAIDETMEAYRVPPGWKTTAEVAAMMGLSVRETNDRLRCGKKASCWEHRTISGRTGRTNIWRPKGTL